MILVDVREKHREIITSLFQSNDIPFVECRLDYADYSCPDSGWGIERKTISDFIGSINNLTDYLYEIQQLYQYPYLLLEGRIITNTKTRKLMVMQGREMVTTGLTVSSMTNFLTSIQLKGIMILYTWDIHHTAMTLMHLWKYYNKSYHIPLLPRTTYEDRIVSKRAREIAALCMIPSIGKTMAIKLLHEFNTVYNITIASEYQLQQIKGIGKELSLEIIDFFGSRIVYRHIHNKKDPWAEENGKCYNCHYAKPWMNITTPQEGYTLSLDSPPPAHDDHIDTWPFRLNCWCPYTPHNQRPDTQTHTVEPETSCHWWKKGKILHIEVLYQYALFQSQGKPNEIGCLNGIRTIDVALENDPKNERFLTLKKKMESKMKSFLDGREAFSGPGAYHPKKETN